MTTTGTKLAALILTMQLDTKPKCIPNVWDDMQHYPCLRHGVSKKSLLMVTTLRHLSIAKSGASHIAYPNAVHQSNALCLVPPELSASTLFKSVNSILLLEHIMSAIYWQLYLGCTLSCM